MNSLSRSDTDLILDDRLTQTVQGSTVVLQKSRGARNKMRVFRLEHEIKKFDEYDRAVLYLQSTCCPN